MAVPPATDTGTPDAQSTSVDPVVVQPNESSSDSPENGNGADPTPTQTGDSAGSGQTTGGVNASPTGSSGDESQSGDRSGPPSVVAPSPSTSGAGATTGVPWPTVGSAGPGGGTSGGGLPPGAIAGLVGEL
jgi:collagen type III alpha